jgi:hypothetical protein
MRRRSERGGEKHARFEKSREENGQEKKHRKEN